MKKLWFLFLLLFVWVLGCDSGVKHTSSCGDEFLDPGEECDGEMLSVMTCTDLGYYGQVGTLSCRANCTIDLAACSGRCGDGVFQGEFEECEGTNLNGETCQSRGQGVGALGCTEQCGFDISGCAAQSCGDGVITPPIEECEGTNLNGETCQTRDYHGGLLRCTSDCKFDEDACATFGRCGDGTIQEAYEECEGVDLNGQTCAALGYHGGTLLCSSQCDFVLDDCAAIGRCGDGEVQAGFEDCDGTNLAGASCVTLGYNAGILSCDGACQFSLASCEASGRCGDDTLDAAYEDCDGGELGGQTCAGLGNFFGGVLGCTGACMFDEGQCMGVVVISAGYNHTCALVTDGTIRCWGENTSGQLGDGTTTQRLTPVPVTGITTAVALSAGYSHTCALLADGALRCWGAGTSGQLGDGTTAQRLTPVPVMTGTIDGFGNPIALSGVTNVSVSSSHTCAIMSDGTAKCWGDNSYGKLGDGTTSSKSYPTAVSGLSSVSMVSAGPNFSCARLSNSTVKCWGYNYYGSLGDGTNTNSTTPVAVTGLTTATSVNTGDYHACARLSDDTVKCWGYNAYGQLGDNTTTQRTTPVAVAGLSTAASVNAGASHTCARLSDDTVKCWGRNYYGQLGDNTTTQRITPVTVVVNTGGIIAAQEHVADLAVGGTHNCLRLTTGELKCWGANAHGQLGDNSTTQRTTPTPVTP